MFECIFFEIFAFEFLGSVHNWKQKSNQNTVRKAEIKDFGVWQEAGNTENLAEPVLQRLPCQGGLQSYIRNQIAGCFTSQTEQPAFLSFLSLFCIFLFIHLPAFQSNLSLFHEKEKRTIPLIQNLRNKHLSGTHCCWLLFRWCICRADHQSNSRLQLLLCCSKCCFYKNNAYRRRVKKCKHHLCHMMDDTTRKHRKWKHDFYGFQNRSWPLPPMNRHEPESTASIGSWKETFLFFFKMQRIKAKKTFTWKNSNMKNSPRDSG